METNVPPSTPPAQPTPSTSDLASIRPARSRRAARLALIGMITAACLLVGAGAAALIIVEHQQREVERVLKHLIDIQTPPTNDKLFTILSKGVTFTEDEYRTDAVLATPEAAFATDLTVSQQTNAYTQEALVSNTDLTAPPAALHYLCVRPFAWQASTTCAATCAASGMTCSAAATDGLRLSPGQMISRRWDGTNCVCVMGSVNPTAYQTERIIR